MSYQYESKLTDKDRKNKNWHSRHLEFRYQNGKKISWKKFKKDYL